MQDKKLSQDIPDYLLMPYHMQKSCLPVMLDLSPTGYGDGKYKRRERRLQERKNKKHNGR